MVFVIAVQTDSDNDSCLKLEDMGNFKRETGTWPWARSQLTGVLVLHILVSHRNRHFPFLTCFPINKDGASVQTHHHQGRTQEHLGQVRKEAECEKADVLHVYSGILLSHRREQNGVICRDADGPRDCHTEWSKSEREKQISYISYMNAYMWNPEK